MYYNKSLLYISHNFNLIHIVLLLFFDFCQTEDGYGAAEQGGNGMLTHVLVFESV